MKIDFTKLDYSDAYRFNIDLISILNFFGYELGLDVNTIVLRKDQTKLWGIDVSFDSNDGLVYIQSDYSARHRLIIV